MIHVGDCREVMAGLDAESIDAIVTDPPYGLSFMGKGWDHGVPGIPFWAEALRVLKPGAHLVAFGGDRTVHRLACAIEDAGFEIRNQLAWLHGQGFPKNLNVSAALRSKIPLDSQCVCGQHSTQTVEDSQGDYPVRHRSGGGQLPHESEADQSSAPSPVGALARTRDGQHGDGLAFSPTSTCPDGDSAHPSTLDSLDHSFRPSVACQASDSIPSDTASSRSSDAQMEPHRTAQNTPHTLRSASDSVPSSSDPPHSGYANLPHCTTCGGIVIPDGLGTALKPAMELIVLARKPLIGTVSANVTAHGTGALNIDGCRIGFASDDSIYAKNPHTDGTIGANGIYGAGVATRYEIPQGRWPANVVLDEEAGELLGEPARFFYTAKASRSERNAGLEGMPKKTNDWQRASSGMSQGKNPVTGERSGVTMGPRANHHPTVKPISLMRWLCRLVMPSGGVILDPFLGSGTTGCAAALEGMGFVGIEMDPEYAAIAERRIAYWGMQPGLL